MEYFVGILVDKNVERFVEKGGFDYEMLEVNKDYLELVIFW